MSLRFGKLLILVTASVLAMDCSCMMKADAWSSRVLEPPFYSIFKNSSCEIRNPLRVYAHR